MHYPLSLEIVMEDVWNYEDPPDFDCISYKGTDPVYVKVEFAAPMPPKKPEVEAPISNEFSISDYC